MFYKTDKERSFAYSAHTACDPNGIVLGVKVTAGNVHDIVMLKPLVEEIKNRIQTPDYVVADAGYRSAPMSHYFENTDMQFVVPYRNNNKSKGPFRKSNFIYNSESKTYTCPEGKIMKERTVSSDGNITFRCDRGVCKNCPSKNECFSKSYSSKMITRHIWADAMDKDDVFRKTPEGKLHYSGRKETIERVFADCKEQHGMRYTRLRGIEKVTQEVYLIFACMNIKKMINRMRRMGRLTA
jgi:5-methylcytosine-specific restriction endonuclease McrA